MQVSARIWISVVGIAVTLAATTPVVAGEDTPEALLDAFFSRAGIADKTSVYTGEMLERFLDKPTLGQMLREDLKLTPRLIEKKPPRAVYAVEAKREDTIVDWYVFLREEQHTWKLEALRSLALTGPIQVLIERLRNVPNRSPEQERDYQNFLLTLASDQQLKAYLRTHHQQLQALADLAQAGHVSEATARAKAQSLHLVELSGDKKIIQIVIGGILDNTVGFMRVTPGASVPTMDPKEYIYIEQVVDNWYVYKTT
ncbi:MAG: hypothetical protein E8D46_08485 [Nitrospira sp.]|nr:hypothetical protein [Nitrospira sp.]TKB73907.1 MAG: hypothetical protein E8D46_08485 [Nitrospira sp.]